MLDFIAVETAENPNAAIIWLHGLGADGYDFAVIRFIFPHAPILGKKIKDGKNQKTLLSLEDEEKIISAFANKKPIDDFSVVLTYDKIKAKNYSLAAGQYFDIKIEYSKITPKEFQKKIADYGSKLGEYFKQGKKLETEILKNLGQLRIKN